MQSLAANKEFQSPYVMVGSKLKWLKDRHSEYWAVALGMTQSKLVKVF
jgi:hypothetical protein